MSGLWSTLDRFLQAFDENIHSLIKIYYLSRPDMFVHWVIVK